MAFRYMPLRGWRSRRRGMFFFFFSFPTVRNGLRVMNSPLRATRRTHKLRLNDSLYRSSPCPGGEKWGGCALCPSAALPQCCMGVRELLMKEPGRRNWGQQTKKTSQCALAVEIKDEWCLIGLTIYDP